VTKTAQWAIHERPQFVRSGPQFMTVCLNICTRVECALLNVWCRAKGSGSHHGIPDGMQRSALRLPPHLRLTRSGGQSPCLVPGRTGSVSTKAGAGELAAYYASEQTMASYYGRMGAVRPDLSPALAERLGLDPARPATPAEVASLMQGGRADGEAIRGRIRRAGPRTGFVDFT
jgi:hypothetical protein